MMTKFCNFRPILFISISILLGLILSYFVLLSNYVGIGVEICFALFVLIILLLKFRKLKLKHYLTLIICFLCFLTSFLGLNYKFSSSRVSSLTDLITKVS